jgi:hypothetical protein
MLFKILHGDASRISTNITPYHEGYCYVTHDGDFYVDMNDERVKLNAKDAETIMGASLATILSKTDLEIPTSNAVLSAIEAATEVYVGPTRPTDQNIKVWINTAEEGAGVTPILPIVTSVDLPASGWTGSNPYSQTVDVPSASSMSMITLQPSAQQIVALQDEEISMTVENDGNGVITFYAINGIPTFDMTMQILISAVAYA